MRKYKLFAFVGPAALAACLVCPVFAEPPQGNSTPRRLNKLLQEEIKILEHERIDKKEKVQSLTEEIKNPSKQSWDDFMKHPGDLNKFKSWFASASGGAKKDVEAKRALKDDLEKEIAALEEKIPRLERDLQDIERLSPPEKTPEGRLLPETKALLEEEIQSMRAQLREAEASLKNAEAWRRDYPKDDWAGQINHWQETIKTLQDQIKQKDEELRADELGSSGANASGGSGAYDAPPVEASAPSAEKSAPTAPPTAEDEISGQLRAKGLSNLQIKILQKGGVITARSGETLRGWPPKSSHVTRDMRDLGLTDLQIKTLKGGGTVQDKSGSLYIGWPPQRVPEEVQK